MALSDIQRVPEMRVLLRLLAARSGQVVRPGSLASELGLPQTTIARYLSLLEEVFLIKKVPAWVTNLSARATSAPKLAFVDSGIAANVLGQTPDRLSGPASPLGGLLEGFVTMEVARQLTWSEVRAEQSHYRTRDQVEVDIVLESRHGDVVAIGVKASSTVSPADFAGMRHLASRLGKRLVLGLVLHTGQQTVPFGPIMRAMPISALWQVGSTAS